jgi:plastocyanin domain-containing protein
MSTSDWTVVALGAGAIAWVNWYFFVAGRAPARGSGAAVASTGAAAEVTITVDGGYAPKTVRVPAGKPVRLIFDRRDNASCSEEVVFPDFGIRRFLPTGARTTIEVTPPSPGTYEFMCGMSMLRGTLIAE